MENAVAGPSSLTRQSPNSTPSNSVPAAGASGSSPNSKGHPPLSYPVVYLPPPGPPPLKQHLASTQDLLGRLQLHPAYDKYVRPYIQPQSSATTSHVLLPDGTTSSNPINGVDGNTPGAGPATPGGVGAVDKGKGREVPMPGGDVDMHDAGDGDDDGDGTGKGEKKKKNSYKHLIKGIPGKHSIKKDDYLVTMMLVPPKQRTRIRRFDEKTQEDAFTLSLDGLKGWNINTLVVESAQAREDRKRRKEAKKAAKFGQLPFGANAPSIPQTNFSAALAHPQPLQAVTSASTTKPATSTPKPSAGTPRPGSKATNGGGPGGGGGTLGAGGGVAGGPRPVTSVPRPGSAVPRPGSTVPKPANQAQAPSGLAGVQRPTTATVAAGDGDQQRGKKRERDEAGLAGMNGVNGTGNGSVPGGYVNGNGHGVGTNGVQQKAPLPPSQHGVGPGIVMNSKAGTGNVRPRPIKKQRMDMQGQSRDVTAPVQQQPTPQGV